MKLLKRLALSARLSITRFALFIMLLLLLGIGIQPLYALDAVVGSGTPASCTEAAFNSALTTAQVSGGEITFNCGGAATIDFQASKTITSPAVTINGAGLVTLNGGGAVRHFYVEGGAQLTLKNISLTNGYDNSYGGGAILNYGALTLDNATIRDSNVSPDYSGGAILSYGPVTITDSLIENNTGGSVGGLFLLGETADATISGSTFRNNRTTNASYGLGGAITLWDGADVTIDQSTLEQNKAVSGGALYNSFSTGVIQIAQNSLLSDNSAANGGAIYSTDGEVTIDHSTIRNNKASISGGGVSSWAGSLIVTDATFEGNTVSPGGFSAGGGIDNAGADVMLFNVTMSRNSADTGGAIYNYGSTTLTHVTFNDNSAIEGSGIYYENGSVTLQNVLLEHGTYGTNCDSPYGPSVLTSLGHNLSSDNSCDFKQAGDLNNSEALLGPLADNGGLTLTHMLLDGSPAIDAGQCIGLAMDQRDLPRLQGSACDIGALERQPGDKATFVYLPLVIK